MTVLRKTGRVLHSACGTVAIEVVLAPAARAIEAVDFGQEGSPEVLFESGGPVTEDVGGLGSEEHDCYWCPACREVVAEADLVPEW